MKGRFLVAVLGVALVVPPALAQEPPPRPPDDLKAGHQQAAPATDARPPSRPDVSVPDAPLRSADDPVADDPVNGDQTAADPPDAAPDPTAPPAWQALAESELSYRFCLLNLTMLGVGYREVATVTSSEDADCGIARPVQVDSPQPGVSIAGGAMMRCDTARRLALWLRNEAQPAAALLPGAPQITALLPGSTYQCRARIGGQSEKLSEHALGNAFDVAGLRFSNDTEMLIAPRGDSGGIEEGFQKAIRYGACLYFTTVLGPGSNAAHDDHLHFDGAARKGGWRLCE
ncbi:extensin-like domain-containing protein [Paracoccus xiamenensis]|uniref:extensin-like domain-containing protein n=1 Tax=Paracoccus xiamenensis TaxID=2714901 RepID=UPI00140DC514|nr:extensin family protein [Paracoccus xiamenensis]NHF73667.1 extensin family protein [Paracoccus xiamenensis]